MVADLIGVDDLATPVTETPPDFINNKGRRASKPKVSTKFAAFPAPMDLKPLNSPSLAPESSDGLVTPTEGMSARQLNVLKRKLKSSKAHAANKYIS